MNMLHNATLRRLYSAPIIVSIILLFSLFCSSVNAAQTSSDSPSRSEVQQQLDELNKQKVLNSEDKLIHKDLTETLETLDKIDRVKEEGRQLKNTLAQAPARLKEASDALNDINANPSDDEETRQSLDTLSLRILESRLTALLDRLQNANNDLSAFNSQLVSLQTQPERAQNEMYNAAQQLQQVRNRLNGTSPGDSSLRSSQKNSLLAQQSLLNTQIELQRKSLEGNTVLQDALQKQRDYTAALINNLQHSLQLLQEAVNRKRLTLTEKTAQLAASSDESGAIQNDPIVRQEMEINHQISQRLIRATQSANDLVQRSMLVKNWLDRAQQAERNLKEQIQVLKGSLLLSRILYQQQQNLPSADALGDLTNQIADLRLEQFDINQQRDALFQSEEYVAKLEQKQGEKNNDEVHDALLQIIDSRRELLDQLNKQLGNQLITAINLQINQQQLVNVSNGLEKTLTQQLFWVKSNKPMDWEWIKAYPGALHAQLKSIGWYDINAAKLHHALFASLFTGVPLFILALVLRSRFSWVDRRLATLAAQVGQLRGDSQLNTPQAILLNTIKVLPTIFIILACGLFLLEMQTAASGLLWAFSKELALYWLVFGLTLQTLNPQGLAVSHFALQPAQARHYRRQMVRIAVVMVPLLFWSVVVEVSPLHLLDDALGQSMIFLNLLLIAGLSFPLCRDSWRDKESHSLRLVTVTVLSLVSLVLLVLTATGYFYTTLRLANRWIDTLYLVVIWNLVHQTVIRGLSVAARRIAYRRALARRQNLIKEGAEGAEPIDEPSLAIEQINQQTMRITMLLMFSLFAVAFYAIWSDLITVFAYLDSIILWRNVVTEAGGSVVKSVTMGSLLFAFIAAMVAWALMRNLPGLLEVLILSRLNMRQGASYAITTILNYVITVIGAMVVFGALGVSWDKLQWLAAALSVGLGFGLQEIFGNFVSGLIILFERPVRIGDTVTIGNFSGTVSKIRIRATTITDFDRKEVIIPNKAFVTERLINWSLSDTVTRVVIRLGVAYGSDLDKVKSLLLSAAMDHPRVMRDPAPSVYFTEFGASTLAHELRFYVRELRDRSNTVDELNRRIDKLCRENDINIAFNQLEVHLHNEKGESLMAALKTEDSRPGPDASAQR